MVEPVFDPNHTLRRHARTNGDWEINCSCGAMWTHKSNETQEKMQSIYESHLKYANRPKMETL